MNRSDPVYYLPDPKSKQAKILRKYGPKLAYGLEEELSEFAIALTATDDHLTIDSLYDSLGYLLMIIHAIDDHPIANIAIWIQHQKDRGRDHRHWFDQMPQIALSFPNNGDDLDITSNIINRIIEKHDRLLNIENNKFSNFKPEDKYE